MANIMGQALNIYCVTWSEILDIIGKVLLSVKQLIPNFVQPKRTVNTHILSFFM